MTLSLSITEQLLRRALARYDNAVLGVVSTKPGLTLSEWEKDSRTRPVALSGRVPVKVTGNVSIGDYITSSDTPGVGMKATHAGMVIGRALESYSGTGTGTVTVFVSPEYYNPSIQDSLQGADLVLSNLLITGDLTVKGTLTVTDLVVTGNITVQGNLTVEGKTELNGDVQVKGRVYSYGEAPDIEIAPALGSLGTAAISGTDTAGSVVFKAGAGLTETLGAGEAIHVSFTGTYNYEPRVQVTPTSETAAGLEYYVQRDADGFKIVFTKPLESGREYRFDYFIIGAGNTSETASQ